MIGYGMAVRELGPADFYRRRRARRQLRLSCGGTPSLAPLEDHEFLLMVCERMRADGGKAPGPDSIRLGELGRRETAALARGLAGAIRSDSYWPGSVRLVTIPKAGGRGMRTLKIRNLADRVVSRALLEILGPAFEPLFDARSHGFRPHRSPWTLLAALEADVASGRHVLATDDVRSAFDAVAIAPLVEKLRETIADDRLIKLTESIIRGRNDSGRAAGIDQGDPISPLLLNVSLHRAHDLAFQGAMPGILWLRYADNLTYACTDEGEGEEALAVSEGLLLAAGYRLKHQDGPPVDIRRDACQLLGFVLRMEGDRIRHEPGRDAWANLETGLASAHDGDDPPATASAACRGWIGSLGPALGPRHAPAVVGRVLETAVNHGFREIASMETVLGWCREAHLRWERTRRDHGGGGIDG